MTSCSILCISTLALVSAFLVVSTDGRSWDIAVTIGQEVNFFAKNGTLMSKSKVADAKMLTGLAYDSVNQTMYMSDRKNEKIFMYSNNLIEKKSDAYTMLNKTNGAQIISMMFDPMSRILFWADARHGAIMKMHVPWTGKRSPPEVLHDLQGHTPYGIALDICKRLIFWSSCKAPFDGCTIERSKLDGSDRKVVVNDNLYDVFGLAVDHSAGKLYWVDDLEGIAYNIERSNFDGSERVSFTKGLHHEPLYIAVDNEAVYWTDRQSEAVWKMEKNAGVEDSPIKFKSYSTSHPRSHVMSIITRDNIGDINCDDMLKGECNRLENPKTPKPLVKSFNYFPTRNDIHLQCTCNSDGYWMPLANIHMD